MHRSHLLQLSYLLSVLLLITACRKDAPQYPYKDIARFVVKDADGAELKAVIDKNDIIIYWPPFMSIPDSVTPVITLSDRAKSSPASGEKIAFREGALLTVTAQDGSTQLYKLKPVINQPKPYYALSPQAIVGDIILISEADYIIPDEKKTRLSLIAKDGKETPLQITYLRQNGVQAKVPALDAGMYKLKFITGIYTMEDPVELIYGTPYIPWSEPVQLKKGNNLQLQILNTYTTGATKVTTVRLKGEQGNFYPLDIIRYEQENILQVKIPDNLSAGVYNAIELSSQALKEPFVQDLPPGQEITILP